MRSLFLSSVFILIWIAAIGQETKIVVLDPGHGGHDSGAIGANGVLEKDIVLSIALETAAQHALADKAQFEIYLTRSTDTFVNLKDRSTIPKILKADLFISLHCNYSLNPDARGLEVYLRKNLTVFEKESLAFATILEHEFISEIGFESRGVKFMDFQILRDTGNICTSVLFEIGFLSNIEEADYLKNYGKIIAYALLKTIKKNLKL